MSARNVPRGPRLTPTDRRACAVCGKPNVAHTRSGEPHPSHVATRGHREALGTWTKPAAEPVQP